VPNTRFAGNSLKANAGFQTQWFSSDIYYDYSSHKIGLAEPEAISYSDNQKRGRKAEVFYMNLENNLLSFQNKIFLNKYKLEINAAYQQSGLIHAEGKDEISIDMALKTLTYETRLYLPSAKNSEYIIGFQGFNQSNFNQHNRETILLPNANLDNYSFFGLLQSTFWERLKVQSGIRYDFRKISTQSVNLPSESTYRPAINKTYGSFSGSVGATYNQSEKLLFRFNFAAAYRTPNLAELTSNGLHETRYELGNINLVPQKAYESDFSMHYHAGNLTFDVAGFYNQINHYIFLAPSADFSADGDRIYRYQQTDARLFGAEAGVHFHPKQLEWLHVESTFAHVTGKNDIGDNLPFIPANKIQNELRFEKAKLGFLRNVYLKMNVNIVFKQNKPAPEEEETSGYNLFDIGIGANIHLASHPVSVSLGISNLFDEKYVDHLSTLKEVGYYNPGRNFTFSLKIPFALTK
jgi:iron complex outermembrane recepter protein